MMEEIKANTIRTVVQQLVVLGRQRHRKHVERVQAASAESVFHAGQSLCGNSAQTGGVSGNARGRVGGGTREARRHHGPVRIDGACRYQGHPGRSCSARRLSSHSLVELGIRQSWNMRNIVGLGPRDMGPLDGAALLQADRQQCPQPPRAGLLLTFFPVALLPVDSVNRPETRSMGRRHDQEAPTSTLSSHDCGRPAGCPPAQTQRRAPAADRCCSRSSAAPRLPWSRLRWLLLSWFFSTLLLADLQLAETKRLPAMHDQWLTVARYMCEKMMVEGS